MGEDRGIGQIKARKLTLLGLAATIFFCVSGGPFGLEPALQSGAGVGLLMIALAPIVWAAPIALMTAELSSAMPVEGGYYVWVKEAMGPFAGFLCAWWSWVYSWFDAAIYPTLFFAYLHELWVQLGATDHAASPWFKWAVGLALVVPLTLLNIRGARITGQWSIGMAALLLVPFIAMLGLGFHGPFAHPPHGFLSSGKTVGAALFVVMWNYLGWDSMSTVAGEVERPKSYYPKAIGLALPLVAVCYLAPAVVGLSVLPDTSQWSEGAWTRVAALIGGPALAVAVTVAGVMSAAGMFASDLLSASRLPFVLAEDGYLPPFVARLGPRSGMPVAAIVICAVLFTLFSYDSFQSLTQADVVLYSSALVLEFAALVVFRIRRPNLQRPYRIPGGFAGVLIVAAMPTLLMIAALGGVVRNSGVGSLALCAAGVISGLIAYPICRAARKRLAPAVPNP